MRRLKVRILAVILFCCSVPLPSFLFAMNYTWTTLADFHGVDKFNLFLKGDLYYYLSDVEGRVAVKGNAYLKAFSIGLKAKPNDFSLIVGGNLEAGGPGGNEGGQVNNGGIFTGENAKLERVGLPKGNIEAKGNVELKDMAVKNGDVKAKGSITMTKAGVESGDVEAGGDVELNDLTINGNVKSGRTITLNNSSVTSSSEESGFSPTIDEPFDFDLVDLATIANDLLNSTNGNINGAGTGELILECNDPIVCYFNISASDIENAGLFKINASSDKTIVINVTGSGSDGNLTIADMGFKLLGGIRSTNILYNFYGFENVYMHGVGIPGSILASNATVNFYNGNMEGILMANNLIGGSWKNNVQGGQINSPVPIPEPSTIFLLFIGATCIFFYFLHRIKLATLFNKVKK